MTTAVQFYTQPTNLDHLLPDLRFAFGDLTGKVYSDTIMRSALISAVRMLQRRWNSKYQVYSSSLKTVPQPSDIAPGYVEVNTAHGLARIPEMEEGDIFRNPYLEFTQASPPLLAGEDESAIVFAATYILRRTQVSSSAVDFVSWTTEDIRYSNLGAERSLSALLADDLARLNSHFASRIATPKRSDFPVGYIPTLSDLI